MAHDACHDLAVLPLVFSDPAPAAAFWVAFVLWNITLWKSPDRHAEPAIRSDHGQDGGSQKRLAGLTLLGLVAAFPLAWVSATAIPGQRWIPVTVGVAMILMGVGLRAWAMSTLGRFFTGAVVLAEQHRVVDTGPYRVVRHPAYAGVLLSMFGTGLALGNWLSLMATVVFGLAAIVQRIMVEESVLTAGLGSEYVAFGRTRQRIVPWVW